MGQDSKPIESGGKGKRKQARDGITENALKGKGRARKVSNGLGTCTYVKGLELLGCPRGTRSILSLQLRSIAAISSNAPSLLSDLSCFYLVVLL